MQFGYVLIGILVNFLVGYAIGRQIGLQEGYLRGLSFIPLKMREDTYLSGKCPICSKEN